MYDFWFPVDTSDGGGDEAWTDGDNAINNSWLTYASADLASQADETASLNIEYADYDGYQDDGDIVEIRNGFVTSFKGVWRVNVGKYGEITKI